MQVTSNCPGRRRLKRPPLAAVLMLALAGLGGVAQAVEFDEKLKAPMMKSAAELRTQAQSFATKYREVRAATPAQMITNTSLAQQQFDLTWQLERAVNEGRALDELQTGGLVKLGDGSYSVDLAKHPEWRIQGENIKSIFTSTLLDPICAALLERGFRPEDVATLKSYIATHDANASARAASLPIALGFRRVVQKFDKAGRPVPDALVISYWYQSTRITIESNRAWAAGLLKALDAQRARILLSYLMEVTGSQQFIPESVSTAISQTLASIRMPDFEQRAAAEARGDSP